MKLLFTIIQTTVFFMFFEFSILTAYKLTKPVKTNAGLVQGKVVSTIGKKIQYSSFLGIPYAKPPVGFRRFQPPEYVDAWKNIYQATQEKNICLQRNPANGFPMGNEDCLYLNVYTPKVDTTDIRLRAVMIWIHGGSFDSGSSSPELYGPDFLIEDDVVVVAMNYRLGPLGFLSLNHSNATGNAGLKDQNLAMKWVQQNIEHFGGDPMKVTIFGQSAGSVATLYHVLSDQSNGLFRSAIAMSGSPLNAWGFLDMSEAIARSFSIGNAMGIETTNASLLLEKLYNASADHITLAATFLSTPSVPFLTPTIENSEIAANPIITECTVKKLRTGHFNHVPIIIGFVNVETLSFVGLDIMSRIELIDGTLAAVQNFSELLETQEIQYLQKIRNKTEGIINLPNSDLYQISNISSDILFNYGIDRTERFLAASNTAPVYYYRNSFDYSQSLHKLWGINLNGTSHADDIAHIFWVSNKNQSLDPLSDIGIQRGKIVKMWTNFAKYSNPTPKMILDPLVNISWPVSGSTGTCLEIDTNAIVGSRPISNFLDQAEKAMETSLDVANGCLKRKLLLHT